MPLTYHFKPVPGVGEPHFETLSEASERSGLTDVPCDGHKDQARCSKCRQLEREDKSIWKRPSQTVLSPIKETPDPARRQLTPKAIRDKRRASSRMSASAAFQSAVACEDYFPLYNSRSFSRSESSSSGSSRSRSSRRHGSSSSSQSRSASSDQEPSPRASDPTQDDVLGKGEEVSNKPFNRI